MRRSLTTLLIATLALLVGGCSSAATTTSSGGYPERSATVGTVDVKAQLTQLDPSGAAFSISLDTHSGSLDADLAATSTLQVDGRTWASAGWDGDPPTGHHRTGTLRFTGGGPVAGTVTLTIGGLTQPTTFTWDAAGSA